LPGFLLAFASAVFAALVCFILKQVDWTRQSLEIGVGNWRA
jgi:uncharacterized membrane protein